MAPPEDRWKAVGEFIRNQRRVADMSLRQLSHLAKVSNPYLSQIERGIYKPSAEVLKAIADALQIRSETLFARAGFIDEAKEQRGPTDTEKAIKVDPHLSPEQKTALIRIYRSFVHETEPTETPAARPAKQGKQKTKQQT